MTDENNVASATETEHVEAAAVATSWLLVAVLWAPVIMKITGSLVPTLEALDALVSPVFERMAELYGMEGVSGSEQPDQGSSEPPEQPGPFLLVGLLQISVLLFIVFIVLFLSFGFMLAGLLYIIALVMTPIMAISQTRRYMAQRGELA